MVNGFKLTAKFIGKTKVEVVVQNLITMTIHSLVWDFTSQDKNAVVEAVNDEIISLDADEETTVEEGADNND